MNILQKPDLVSFENNLPDIIIERTGAESSISFKLYHEATLIIEESYAFDIDGLIFIRDLSSLVSLYFDKSIITAANFTASTGLIKQFSFVVDQAPAESFKVIRSSAVIAGTGAMDFVRNGFLTRLPQQKRTAENMNEYLSFVMFAQDDAFQIKYKVFYRSAGQILESTGVLLEVASDQVFSRVITFNASLSSVLTQAQLAPELVYEYRIWAECAALEITFSQFSFFPDYAKYRHQNTFVFSNCFDVPEVVRTTGVTKSAKNIEAGFSISGRRMKKSTQEFEILKTTNSGFLSRDEMNWLDDLVTSYSVSKLSAGDLEEVVITSSEKSETTENSMQSFSFTYRSTTINHISLIRVISGIFDHTFDNTFE